MISTAIEAFDLEKRFHDGVLDVHVLKGISVRVTAGETVAILGTSGSGKSTLLHLLGGLDKPTLGRVEIDGRDLANLDENEQGKLRNRQLGFVYQFHHLLPEFSALENVAMPLLIGGSSFAEARRRAAHCLAQVGLKERAQHRPAELSGGERQRTAIARAVVTNPTCVLADEPTGNLDAKNSENIINKIHEISVERDIKFIIATQNQRFEESKSKCPESKSK